MTDNAPPDDVAARIAAIKAKMSGGAAPAPAAPSQPAAAAPPAAAPAAAAPAAPAAAGGGAGGDMAAKIAAIKAKMGGAAAPAAAAAKPAAPAAAAAAKPAAPAAAPAAAGAGGEAEMAARIAALKAKMESGKGAPPAPAKPAAAAPAAAAKPAPAKAGAKAIFPVAPIDRTSFGDERLYGGSTLNKWFTVGGLMLLIGVVWMLRHDWVRDWKDFQQEFRELKIDQTKAALAEAEQAVDPKEKAEIEAQLAKGQAEAAAQQDKLDTLDKERLQLDGEYYRANQLFQFAKSKFDAARYRFEELAVSHADPSRLAGAREELENLRVDMETKQKATDNLNLALEAKKAEVASLQADRTAAEKRLAAMGEKAEAIRSRLAKIDHNIFNDFIRNAPIADMLAPTLKIDQIVLEKLKDNYNFMHVGRIDRCTTCHVGIDDRAFSGDEWRAPGKRVFMAHPRLDLFVADNSPHPKNTFGCTVCHLGRGQAVEFPRTFHVPAADEFETFEQKEERWVHEYGFQPERHYWDWPMVPANKLYSSCFQCHQSTDRIQGVPQYNDSREQVEKLGCFGCHKIQGFEHLRKVGPDLTNIAAKTTETWARKWVMDPRAFRPTTRMPQFWNQSNTGGHMGGDIPWNNNSDDWVADYRARNDVEARAVVAYIFAQSKAELAKERGYRPLPAPTTPGDAAAGKTLFHDRGCLGCHSMSRDQLEQNWHGPELSKVGSKVSAQWIHDWLLDPKKYYPTTAMPNLRLTDKEAWDITAYLLQGKDAEWEGLPEPKADDAILDQIAVEYIAPTSSDDFARGEVAKWRAEGGAAKVELFVGEKLFSRYGCAGCHLVPGHYDDKGVGTELTYEGLKELSKFDFGFEEWPENPDRIPNTRHDWFRAKLHDPRVFDRMPRVEHVGGVARVVAFDMKVKPPADKLKMPNFHLDETQIELVTQFLMGLREDGIDESMKRTLTADEKVQEVASRLMTERNCMGCHQIGQLSRPVPIDEDTVSQNLWMAQPLIADGKEVLSTGAWLSDEIFDPWEQEDADTLEFFEAHKPEGPALVFGHGEGGIGTFINEAAMRPPILRGEGAKTQPDWLFNFLINPFIVRTHVNVRMPTFGFTEEQSTALVRWFAAHANQPWPFSADAGAAADPDKIAAGQKRFEKLGCNQCHPAGTKLPSNPDKSNWGPDLGLARARLKSQWIHDWLRDPQGIQPGTKMPSFFGQMKDGEYNAFEKDYEQQIAELKQFLKHMDQAPSAPVSQSAPPK